MVGGRLLVVQRGANDLSGVAVALSGEAQDGGIINEPVNSGNSDGF